MKRIENIKELLALRNDRGVVVVKEGVIVECDVWLKDTEEVSGWDFRGYSYFRGCVEFRNYAFFHGQAHFYMDRCFFGNAYFCLDANFYGEGACFKGDYLIIVGDMYWVHSHKPEMPEKTYIYRVLPPECQRIHWHERLRINLLDGCYGDLCERVLDQIAILLENTKWSSTERWMLETLRDSKKVVPEWVVEIRKMSFGTN